jgi:predicted cupin superfamily sugar epimerase
MNADDVIRVLGLKPLTIEGGHFFETYRSEHSTAIYYLLKPDTFSALHRLTADEVFHFYCGDPVEMLQLLPDGEGRVVMIGNDLLAGHRPQVIAPAGVWQGARLAAGGKFALLGATVAPAFEYETYTHGKRAELVAAYPRWRARIEALTSAR